MYFDHDNVRLVVTEDRLSSLPDELIHKILSCIDTKFVVQTCLLSPRWKHLWRSIPYLNFSSYQFSTLPKFSKFVTNVLSRRNHQTEVFSVKLVFGGAASQYFVRKIANYVFSHNAQELTVWSCPRKQHKFPHCLFSSRSLKHLAFNTHFFAPCLTPQTPWDFPALTTLHLSNITLCDNNTRESIDLFSKCVNLKNLTLKFFVFLATEAFDIITPRLSNLMLIDGRCSDVVNVIAPQLKNITIIHCSIKYLNVPPGISSFCYCDYHPLQLPKDHFHSINKVNLTLKFSNPNKPYKEDDARETINLLHKLHSVRFLTLNLDIVECLSSFPDLISHHPSPFSNLISLNIDSSREEPYKVKFSAEARSFLLENSPTAMLIMDLPEEPLTKAMMAKEARERKKGKLIADIESHMKDLQAAVAQEHILFDERKQAREKKKAVVENLMAGLEVWHEKKTVLIEPKQPQESVKDLSEELLFLMTQITDLLDEMYDLTLQEIDNIVPINSKEGRVRSLLKNLPKRQRSVMEARYSSQFEQIKTLSDHLNSTIKGTRLYRKKLTDALEKNMSNNIKTLKDISSGKLPPPSQPSSTSVTEPLTKAMMAKEATERKNAKLIADIESHMTELQASVAQENIHIAERKQARDKKKAAVENLMAGQEVCPEKRVVHMEPKQQHESVENLREESLFLLTQVKALLNEMHDLTGQEIDNIVPIISKEKRVRSLLENLPKRQRSLMEARYSSQFEQIKTLHDHLSSTMEGMPLYFTEILDALEKKLSNISTLQDVSSRKLPRPSQPSSSSSVTIPTPSTSSNNQCSEPPTQGC